MECAECFAKLRMERRGKADRYHFVSLIANHPNTKDMVEVTGEPVRRKSNFVMGFTDLPVTIRA